MGQKYDARLEIRIEKDVKKKLEEKARKKDIKPGNLARIFIKDGLKKK